MNLLKELHRLNINPLSGNRFVFGLNTPGSEVQAPTPPTEARHEGLEPASAQENADRARERFGKLRSELNQKQEKLVARYEQSGLSREETRALDAYKAKVAKINSQLEAAIGAETPPEKTVARQLTAETTNLIQEIEARADTGATENMDTRRVRLATDTVMKELTKELPDLGVIDGSQQELMETNQDFQKFLRARISMLPQDQQAALMMGKDVPGFDIKDVVKSFLQSNERFQNLEAVDQKEIDLIKGLRFKNLETLEDFDDIVPGTLNRLSMQGKIVKQGEKILYNGKEVKAAEDLVQPIKGLDFGQAFSLQLNGLTAKGRGMAMGLEMAGNQALASVERTLAIKQKLSGKVPPAPNQADQERGVVSSPDTTHIQATEVPVASESIIEKSANEKLTSEQVVNRLTREDLYQVMDGLVMYIAEEMFDPRDQSKPENKDKFNNFMVEIKAIQNQSLDPKQMINKIVEAVQKIDPQGNHDANSLIRNCLESSIKKWGGSDMPDAPSHKEWVTKTYDTILGKRETEHKEEKAKEMVIDNNMDVLGAKLGLALGIKLDLSNPEIREVTWRMLSKLEKGKLEAAVQGDLSVTPDESRTMRTEIMQMIQRPKGKVEKVESGEEDLVAKLKDAEGFPASLKGLNLDKGTSLNARIALEHEIKVGEGGKITVDGRPLEQMQGIEWTSVLNLPGGFDFEAQVAENLSSVLETSAQNNLKARETFAKLGQELSEGRVAEKLGPFESLAALIQLFQSLKAAIQSGDWQTLSDTLQDFNEGKNPAESMKQSRSAYEKALEGKKDAPLDKLLTAYMDPRGKEADALLLANAPEDQKSALSRYRMEARPTIQNHIQKELGLGMISNITKVNDRVQIDAFDEGSKHHFVVESFSVGGQQQVEVRPFSEETVTENNQQVKKEVLTAKDKAIKIPTEGGKAPTMAEIRNFIKDWDKNIKVAAPARPGEKKETVKKPKFTEDQLKKMGTKALKTEIDGAIKANPQLATAEDYTKMEQLKSGKDWGKDGDRTKAQKTLDDARRQWIFKNVTV